MGMRTPASAGSSERSCSSGPTDVGVVGTCAVDAARIGHRVRHLDPAEISTRGHLGQLAARERRRNARESAPSAGRRHAPSTRREEARGGRSEWISKSVSQCADASPEERGVGETSSAAAGPEARISSAPARKAPPEKPRAARSVFTRSYWSRPARVLAAHPTRTPGSPTKTMVASSVRHRLYG